MLSLPRRGPWHKSTFSQRPAGPSLTETGHAMLLFANKHDAVTSLLRPCFSRRGFCLLQRRTRSSLNTPETGDCRIMRMASGKHPNCRVFFLSARHSRVCKYRGTSRLTCAVQNTESAMALSDLSWGSPCDLLASQRLRRPVALTDGLLPQRRLETLIG